MFLTAMAFFMAGTVMAQYSGSQWYGAPWHSEGLGNIPLDGGGYGTGSKIDYRIRAKYTGSVNKIRFYEVYNVANYFAGNGGTIQVELRSDDGTPNHTPSNTVLATGLIANPLNVGTSFPQITFDHSAALTEGQLYHIVWSNTGSNSSQNWVSINCLWQSSKTTPVQSIVNDVDLAVLGYNGTTWVMNPAYVCTPIYDLSYTDGKSQGMGYMEVWVGTEGQMPISGANKVRETFTVSGSSRSVISVSINLKKESGTGDLTIRLEKTDGTVVEEGTIAASSISTSFHWVSYSFATTQTLQLSQSYNLVLSAPSGTTYRIYPIRDGNKGYGFSAESVFADGSAQFTTGSSWVGWTYWGAGNRNEGDLQFYFTIPSAVNAKIPHNYGKSDVYSSIRKEQTFKVLDLNGRLISEHTSLQSMSESKPFIGKIFKPGIYVFSPNGNQNKKALLRILMR